MNCYDCGRKLDPCVEDETEDHLRAEGFDDDEIEALLTCCDECVGARSAARAFLENPDRFLEAMRMAGGAPSGKLH